MSDYVNQVLDLDQGNTGHARDQFDEALAEETTTVMVVMGASEKAQTLRQYATSCCAEPESHWRLINARQENALADIAENHPALAPYMKPASGVLAFSLPFGSRDPYGVINAGDTVSKLTVMNSFFDADEHGEVK